MRRLALTLKKLSGNIYYNNDVYKIWVGLPLLQLPLDGHVSAHLPRGSEHPFPSAQRMLLSDLPYKMR